MLANKMMEDSGDTKESILNHSSEPHVVVACPACKTKFAVESSLVATYDTPKFHCSRCDTIFDFNNHTQHVKRQTPPLVSETNRWVLTDRANDDVLTKEVGEQTTAGSLFSSPQSQDAKQITPLKPSDFTLGVEASHIDTSAPAQLERERAGLSILGLRPAASRRSTTSLTRQEALAYSGTQTDARSISAASFSLFDQTPANPASSTPAVAKTTQPEREPEPKTHQTIKTQAKPVAVSTTTPKAPVAPGAASTGASSRIKQSLLRASSNFSDRTRGLTRLSVPLLATLAGLVVLGYSARLMPETIGSTFEAIVPSVISGRVSHLPPTQLRVQEISINTERASSKESIAVVRGFVQNHGTSKIDDVTIEAIGFNKRGDIVVSAKAPLRSALAREKIADLPLATIKKFQTALSASTSSIGANEKVPFDPGQIGQYAPAGEIAYFSARIFSVGEIRK